jgi:hypothetical protein
MQPERPSALGHTNPAAPTPVFQKPPVSPIAPLPAPPAQAHSGVRHYQGAPDHVAWQLTIKPNPDGTKKVTLISLAQGYQTSCDLGWEIVE